MSGWTGPGDWGRDLATADAVAGSIGKIVAGWIARFVVGVIIVWLSIGWPQRARAGGGCEPCDANCDQTVSPGDIATLIELLVGNASPCAPCAGDADGDGSVDGRDIAAFVQCQLNPPPTGACCSDAATCAVTPASACGGLWLGAGSSCAGSACGFGRLTAHRPQFGAGYFPFTKTAVADVDEESPTVGPGIRMNSPGEVDPAGEDDLIEVLVESTRPEIPVVLRRGSSAMRAWTTRNKAAGSEIAFVGDRTSPLALTGGSTTVWIEWATATHGVDTLTLEPQAAPIALDSLRFHTFHALVMALGGEGQVPTVPVDPNQGTFVVAISLYGRGYDVMQYDEDNVAADGSGAVLTEVVNAVQHRGVEQVAIFGYSHGGGSTYDLADRLDQDRAGIGVFEIAATSYVDSVQNDSDIDVDQELRRPPSTGHHANHYQVGTLSDFFLDGGPVPNSVPGTTGLNVETTPWGAGSTHFTVDDYVQVRGFIETSVASWVTP